MRLRTFTASSMPAAMAEVRKALGEDAIIISSATDARGQVTVKAALDDEPSPPAAPPPRTGPDHGWLEDLGLLLRYHNTPESLAGRLLYKGRHLDLDTLFALQKFDGEDRALLEARALARLLGSVYRFSPLPVGAPGFRLMLTGPPGVGKTVAIAKLAAQMTVEKVKLRVISTDTKRAGGVEQLSAFTDILNLPLQVAEGPAALSAVLKAITPGECLLIDTSGCNPYDASDLDELTALIAVGGFEPVLALPAGMDSFEAADTVRAFAFPAIQRLLITRADATRRFGSLLAAADARGLAFSHVGLSSRVVGELKAMDSATLAQLLLQYRTQTG